MQKAGAVNLADIGRAYVENTSALARGAARFTDKKPLNFFYASLIHRALPNARIVALRRGAYEGIVRDQENQTRTG